MSNQEFDAIWGRLAQAFRESLEASRRELYELHMRQDGVLLTDATN